MKMKSKFFSMALALTSVLTMGMFSACSDDENNDNDNDNKIADPYGWAGSYGLGEFSVGDLNYGASEPRPNVPLSGAFYIDWDTPDATPYNMGKMNAVTFRGILGIYPSS